MHKPAAPKQQFMVFLQKNQENVSLNIFIIHKSEFKEIAASTRKLIYMSDVCKHMIMYKTLNLALRMRICLLS